jgi:hypothetical protein
MYVLVDRFNSNQGYKRFIKTKTFTESESKKVMEALQGEMYFTDFGHIQLKKDKSFFINPLLPKEADVSTNLAESNIVKSLYDKQVFFPIKPIGKYLLYTPNRKKPIFFFYITLFHELIIISLFF